MYVFKSICFYGDMVFPRYYLQSTVTKVEDLVADIYTHFYVIFDGHMYIYKGIDNTLKLRTVAALVLDPSDNL